MYCVFIAGSYHEPWYFENVVDLLAAEGIKSDVLLPIQCTSYTDRITMEDYVARLYELLQDKNEKIILIAHSSGGQIITNFAEKYADLIDKLIYVSGTLLPNDYSNFDIPRQNNERPILPEVVMEGNFKWYKTDSQDNRQKIIEYFYNQCPLDLAEQAVDRLIPQSILLLQHKNKLSEENFGKIDKYYIKCMNDHVIFPSVQEKMIDLVPCKKVYELESDHVPFLSMPRKLSKILMNIINE